MKTSQRYLVSVMALGWIVLVACSVILFWARWHTWSALARAVSLDDGAQPSGLVPDQIEGDPNVIEPSCVSAGCYCDGREALWISDLQQRIADSEWPVTHVLYDAQRETARLTYWDDRSGLFVSRMFSKTASDRWSVSAEGSLYVGPEGVSDRPGQELGRFVRPISPRPSWPRTWMGIVYDGGSRQFYRIDFGNRRVLKGPPIAQGICPLQIGLPAKNDSLISMGWIPPLRHMREGETSHYGRDLVPIDPNMGMYPSSQVMVLDKDARIYSLDAGTLTLSAPVGDLPAVGLRSSNRPQDLLAYDVQSVQIHGQYAGCIVAVVTADGTAMDMSVYDRQGRPVVRRDRYRQTTFDKRPGASGALASQYLLECLHPLSLSLLSRAIGPQVEAVAGHRGLFVLPHSFVATRARESDSYPIDRLFWTVVMLLPAMLLAAFLAWKIAQDATAIGLSRSATRWWIVGTLAFGLPAYITYCMTRPEVTLVTCANCGNLRRPDMDRCHRCGAPWVMPELAPPAWRVMD